MSANFTQLPTLIANISGTRQDTPYITEHDSSGVQQNKSGELWSTIQKVGREFGPTQIDFFGRLYFGP